MSMIGLGLMPFFMNYFAVVVLLAPLAYLFVKWRAYRDGNAADPWLGAAVLLQHFWTLGLQLALAGLALAVAGLIGGKMAGEAEPGLALLFAGMVSLLAAFFVLKRLPASPLRRAAWRIYFAVNLLFCGLIVLIALGAASWALLAGKPADARLPLIALAVFAPAWAWLLRRLLPK